MIKVSRGVTLVLLCTVFIFCQTGCARNKESAKAESSATAAATGTPDASASPSPSYSPEPVNTKINEDFILGVDISGVKSEYKNGARHFDFNGNKLSKCGFNWVSIRTEYGTDNLENIKEIGKLASDAGFKVLIEFCYPDFLADMDMDTSIEEKTEALEEYTVESLIELIDYGVDVCMVQISNKCADETDLTDVCLLINSGCTAVRYVADTMEKEILIALHFTDITKNQYETTAAVLEENQIDYDIFAASYYKHTDETVQNFTDVMKVIAEKYNKEVVATAALDISKVKGKKAAKKVTDMTQSVVNIGEAGIGVFFETEFVD